MKEKILLLMVLIGSVSAQSGTDLAEGIWSKAQPVICGIFMAFAMIAGGIASVIIIYGGIRYLASSDDPGARKAAKDQIVHAMVAMIIIVLTLQLVRLASGGDLIPCEYSGW